MPFQVGVQLWPQHCTVAELRAAWRAADELGVDSIWLWDHFFPIAGDPAGAHFEAYTLLSAMAVETSRPRIGVLVTSVTYRNPDLLADMIRTVDHLSGGRACLGIGAGWYARDFAEYGYDFATGPDRLRTLGAALPRIRDRLDRLDPPPVQDRLPILVGGGGERVTLRLVARYADAWNGFGPVADYARRNAVLDEWCERLGRDPKEIERTAGLMSPGDAADPGPWLDAGAEHLIVGTPAPFDLAPVAALLAARG